MFVAWLCALHDVSVLSLVLSIKWFVCTAGSKGIIISRYQFLHLLDNTHMAGIDISKFKLFEHFATSKLTECKIEIIFAVQVNIIH